MTVRILLLGKNGQVGSALEKLLAQQGEVFAYDRSACDLADETEIKAALEATGPDVIVNAAAYTAVDQAENDETACSMINSSAPAMLAKEAARRNALLVHYSTDYVFDGERDHAYAEADAPNPLNAYGRSKLEGDRAIMAENGKHIILRVGWVYSETGKNFAKTILRLASERDKLTIVNDQFGAPTSAHLIASTTAAITERYIANRNGSFPYGLYHLAAAGRASWHDFALELVSEAKRDGYKLAAEPQSILAIPTDQYPTPARRPANSILNTAKLREAFGVLLPDWRADVPRVVRQLATRH